MFKFANDYKHWGSRANFNFVTFTSDQSVQQECLIINEQLLDRFISAFPHDPPLTVSNIYELLGYEDSADQDERDEPRTRPEPAQMTADFHLWSSIIALQVSPGVTISRPTFIGPTDDEIKQIGYRIFRERDKQERSAIVAWAERNLRNAAQLLDERIKQTHANCLKVHSSEFRLVIDGVLTSSGVPAFVLDCSGSGHVTVGVRWATVDQFVPPSEIGYAIVLPSTNARLFAGS